LLFFLKNAQCQVVIKTSDNYVLIDKKIGETGDLINIHHKVNNGEDIILSAKIISFKNNRTIARLVNESHDAVISIGDPVTTIIEDIPSSANIDSLKNRQLAGFSLDYSSYGGKLYIQEHKQRISNISLNAYHQRFISEKVAFGFIVYYQFTHQYGSLSRIGIGPNLLGVFNYSNTNHAHFEFIESSIIGSRWTHDIYDISALIGIGSMIFITKEIGFTNKIYYEYTNRKGIIGNQIGFWGGLSVLFPASI
jgi:hypothetical protein